MKKLLFVLVAVGLTVVLSGCGRQKTVIYQNIPQPIVEQKENIEQEAIKIEEALPATDSEAVATATVDLDRVETKQGQGDVVCRENSEYLVITKGSKSGVSSFLIKNKASGNQDIPCSYEVGKTDFEIKDQAATYFLALTSNFLVLDIGTGPGPRTLVVYNLDKQKKVFTDNYSNLTSVPGGIIKYWRKSAKNATLDNCPKLDEYSSKGLGAIVETYISLDLSTLVKKELGEYRCSPTQ